MLNASVSCPYIYIFMSFIPSSSLQVEVYKGIQEVFLQALMLI